MGAPLPGGPVDLEDVQPPLVADHAADAVGGLGHGVPVEGQLVVILDEDVVGSERVVESGNIVMMPNKTYDMYNVAILLVH